MEKKIAQMKDLKIGKYVLIDDAPSKVTSVVHSKPGKHGGAKARIDAVGIFDGQKRSLMGPVGQNVEVPMINKKTAQVLNILGEKVQLMDMESYETFELDKPSDLGGELTQGCNVLYMDVMGRKKIIQVQ